MMITVALLGQTPDTQPAPEPSPVVIPSALARVVGREIDQLGGRWTIRWRVRWVGSWALHLDPTRVTVDYSGGPSVFRPPDALVHSA